MYSTTVGQMKGKLSSFASTVIDLIFLWLYMGCILWYTWPAKHLRPLVLSNFWIIKDNVNCIWKASIITVNSSKGSICQTI